MQTDKEMNEIHTIHSVAEAHRFFGLPKPMHPLVSVIKFEDVSFTVSNMWKRFTNNLYTIAIKKGSNGKMKYGQSMYDFDEGIMTLTAPRQVFSVRDLQDVVVSGYLLTFHPDFIQAYPLAKIINNYGFFSYATNEALFLSDKEEQIILGLMKAIELEYNANIDKFSQDVMVATIDLLLIHVDRYYNRQFITRRRLHSDILSKVDSLLDNYFNSETKEHNGLPTVQFLADNLSVSPTHLSDLLKNVTGLTTLQYIHIKLIDKAKILLSTTNLSVSEIAFLLGFEYAQSFNKLFKNKTKVTPLEFRQSFN
ncbi:helix-turn-helix transcriptional regulator [Cytophagaceae bacterium DM2B3-1]|uniref:Helix-turn-helix transcriptional regulator n=1 Tax=Xanthocytophaga flava TaxID=3048013 RepID=A0ABT7CXQ6_9BACT|nr:helix-turn-helix transcriptional regulator [Xanthocytophaga flavus]MDJ1498558.1 helix-turn-helix transcriptional regulator [Xanthocytophaga flavus]